MTKSIYLIATAVSICFLVGKFIEMKFILKENKPLKVLFRDAVFVYISVILGSMIVESFSSVDILKKAPEIFTNKPDF
tara:strand:+ start:376 stop:609 length:234 start_codon:yes stop_codon:yes gene_type:complete